MNFYLFSKLGLESVCVGVLGGLIVVKMEHVLFEILAKKLLGCIISELFLK